MAAVWVGVAEPVADASNSTAAERDTPPTTHLSFTGRAGRRSEGNTEGTPTRAPPVTRGHSSSADSFSSRGFPASGFPAVPAVPASALDGKEGVDGSSPSEGSLSSRTARK